MKRNYAVCCQSTADKHLSLLDTGIDCIGNIVDFMETRAWVQFSYTCTTINKLKYKQYLMISKKRTILGSSSRHPSQFESDDRTVPDSFATNSGMLFNVELVFELFSNDSSHMFKYFKDTIHTLKLRDVELTEDNFQYLKDTINTLDISYCTITKPNHVLKYVEGSIQSLLVCGCDWLVDDHLKYLQGTIRKLVIIGCVNISDANFKYLKDTIRYLDVSSCKKITDAGLKHIEGIHVLKLQNCVSLTDNALLHVGKNIKVLHMKGTQITDAGLTLVKDTITDLDVSSCEFITDKGLQQLHRIRKLYINNCTQITDAAFKNVKGTIQVLSINNCPKLTVKTFEHLRGKIRMIIMHEKRFFINIARQFWNKELRNVTDFTVLFRYHHWRDILQIYDDFRAKFDALGPVEIYSD